MFLKQGLLVQLKNKNKRLILFFLYIHNIFSISYISYTFLHIVHVHVLGFISKMLLKHCVLFNISNYVLNTIYMYERIYIRIYLYTAVHILTNQK